MFYMKEVGFVVVVVVVVVVAVIAVVPIVCSFFQVTIKLLCNWAQLFKAGFS